MFFNTLCMFVFVFCIFVFYSVFSAFLYCFVYFSLSVYSFLFPIFVQVYRPLSPGGNPTAVNKYHIISHHIICHIISYHIIKFCLLLDSSKQQNRSVVTSCNPVGDIMMQ
jgi:hypothetical protein